MDGNAARFGLQLSFSGGGKRRESRCLPYQTKTTRDEEGKNLIDTLQQAKHCALVMLFYYFTKKYSHGRYINTYLTNFVVVVFVGFSPLFPLAESEGDKRTNTARSTHRLHS